MLSPLNLSYFHYNESYNKNIPKLWGIRLSFDEDYEQKIKAMKENGFLLFVVSTKFPSSYARTMTETEKENLESQRLETMQIGDHVVSATLPFIAQRITNIIDNNIILENPINEAASFLMYYKNQNVDGNDIKGVKTEVSKIPLS